MPSGIPTNQSRMSRVPPPPGPTNRVAPSATAGTSTGTGARGTKRKVTAGSSRPTPSSFNQAGPSNAPVQPPQKRFKWANGALVRVNQQPSPTTPPPPPSPPLPLQWPPSNLQFMKSKDKKGRNFRTLNQVETAGGWIIRKRTDDVTAKIMGNASERFLVEKCFDPWAGKDTSRNLHQLRLWESQYPGDLFPLEPQAQMALLGSTDARLGAAHVRLSALVDNAERYLSSCLLLLGPTMLDQPAEAAEVRAIILELGMNVVYHPTPVNPTLAAQSQRQWPPPGVQYLPPHHQGPLVPLSPEDEVRAWIVRSHLDRVINQLVAQAAKRYFIQVCGDLTAGFDTSHSLRQMRIWLTDYPTLLFPQEPQKDAATDLSINARNDGGHNALANILAHAEEYLSACLILLGPTMLNDAAAAAEVRSLIDELGFRVLTQL